LFYFLKNPQRLQKAVYLEGKEYLEQALAKAKGVIILTAHLGNFPLMSLRLAKEGYLTNFVIRPLRDEKAGEYIHNLRTQAGVKTIFSYPRDVCVHGITQTLKNNELVLMQMDQNFGTGGVWVKFFGTLAATPVGPIMFALRTKAAIVPAYIYRKEYGVHCIGILPSVPLTITNNRNETILLNAIQFTRIIEAWIKEWPEQWGWIHRSWKSRPSQKVMQMKFKIEQ
jgi:KDO2-lipid IV(A) lauroyltransferase